MCTSDVSAHERVAILFKSKLMEYTLEEIQSKINMLTNNLDAFIHERKSINTQINNTKKQIKHWSEFDDSQLKAF